jgi:calcium-dependent protein kinase
LSGSPPFNAETDKEIMEQVALGEFDFDAPEWVEVSDAAQELIRKMLAYHPEERYSAEQVLNHPWFKSVLEDDTLDRTLAVSTLTSLQSFKGERNLQEAVWLFFVSHMATKEEKNKMLKIFQALDLNGDGQLSREELIHGYKQIMSSKDAEAEVDIIMKAVDNNHSGTIEYTEFVMATVNKQNMLSKEKLDRIFHVIDKDGNGYLDIEEIKCVLNPNNQREINNKVWLDLIKEFDQDGDGTISYDEFVDMMLRI